MAKIELLGNLETRQEVMDDWRDQRAGEIAKRIGYERERARMERLREQGSKRAERFFKREGARAVRGSDDYRGLSKGYLIGTAAILTLGALSGCVGDEDPSQDDDVVAFGDNPYDATWDMDTNHKLKDIFDFMVHDVHEEDVDGDGQADRKILHGGGSPRFADDREAQKCRPYTTTIERGEVKPAIFDKVDEEDMIAGAYDRPPQPGDEIEMQEAIELRQDDAVVTENWDEDKEHRFGCYDDAPQEEEPDARFDDSGEADSPESQSHQEYSDELRRILAVKDDGFNYDKTDRLITVALTGDGHAQDPHEERPHIHYGFGGCLDDTIRDNPPEPREGGDFRGGVYIHPDAAAGVTNPDDDVPWNEELDSKVIEIDPGWSLHDYHGEGESFLSHNLDEQIVVEEVVRIVRSASSDDYAKCYPSE